MAGPSLDSDETDPGCDARRAPLLAFAGWMAVLAIAA
jgi:hypothetical protein